MQRTSQVILPEPTVEPADEYLSHIGKYLEKYLNRDRETDYILWNSPSWMEYILLCIPIMYTLLRAKEKHAKVHICNQVSIWKLKFIQKEVWVLPIHGNNFRTPSIPMGTKPLNLPFWRALLKILQYIHVYLYKYKLRV